MNQLSLPPVEFRIRKNKGRIEVFDVVRKKFVTLTHEENVRQHFLHFLMEQKSVPSSLIAVEAQIRYNKLPKRCDIVVYSRTGKALLIVECKAPEVKISENVFQQIAMYNKTLEVPYLIVTNGLEHYACRVDGETGKISYLKDLPEFKEMEG